MNDGAQTRTGAAMRRKVRRATVGVLGAAVLATGVVTAGLAYANGTDELAATDSTSATSGSSSATGSDDSTSSDDSAAQQGTTSTLTSPTQAPAASSGGSHTQSGGS